MSSGSPPPCPPTCGSGKIDEDTMETLMERGFFVVADPKDPNGPLEVLSNSGDISLQLADGARYILRFGVTTGESSAAEKAKKKGSAKSEKDDKAKDDSSPGMDRYLFVTADFNQDAIAKPVFDKMPEDKPADKTPEKKPATSLPLTRKPMARRARRPMPARKMPTRRMRARRTYQEKRGQEGRFGQGHGYQEGGAEERRRQGGEGSRRAGRAAEADRNGEQAAAGRI